MVSRLIIIVVAFVCILIQNSDAQSLRDSRGRDFWLALPPNDHSSSSLIPAFLSILVNCDGPTNVLITATARDLTLDVRNTNVPGAAIWEFRYTAQPYELVGVLDPNGPSNDGEKAMPMSIHIVTSEDVSVYAVMRDQRTSDAWLVLPTDALGTSYRVSSYASSAVADTVTIFGIPVSRSFTEQYPSQFVCLATEDSTLVTVDLSVDRSSVANGSRRTVLLNRGQSYLVQARVTETRQNDDLSGSRIVATKPLVVLSAHLRAQVPILVEHASRDCLVEQLPSVDTWGRHIVTPPLKRANDYQSAGSNDVPQCRIMAAEDSTIVAVSGQASFRLDAGSFRDMLLTGPLDVTASKPILVTIIDRTANRAANTFRSGDPSLIVMPPVEQFLSAYRVANAEPRITGQPVFTQHHITCVVPMLASNTLFIDGVATPTPTLIAGTTFGFVHLNVAAGPHDVLCDSAFGIIVYGYGPAESYGYTGGMAFERLYLPSLALRILDVEGFAGAGDTIIAIVDSIANITDLRLSGAVQVAGKLNVGMSTFVPNQATVEDPVSLRGTVPFVLMFDTLDVGDTVAVVIGRHVLGRDTVTKSTLTNIVWTTGAGDTVNVRTTVNDGRVITLGVCTEQLPRLFDPASLLPAKTKQYFDMLGRNVGTSLEGLPPGAYFQR